MHYWTTKPFLRILIPFAGGVLLYPIPGLSVVLCSLVSALIILCLGSFNSIYQQYRWKYLYGCLIHLVFISFGYIGMHLHDIRVDPHWYAAGIDEKQMIFRVTGPAKKKKIGYQCTGEVLYKRV